MKRISTFLVAMLCAVAAIFAGDLYYFAANTKQADGSYVDRYLYVNASGTLATTPECVVGDDHYQWQLVPNGTDAYYLKNAAGKYLSYGPRLTLSDSPYSFQLKDDAVHAASGAKSLYNPTSSGGKYMVLKADGTAFDQYSVPVNNGSWCSDYILTSVSDVVGYTLNVVSNIAAADARFSWNGQEFATSTMLRDGASVTSATLAFVSGNTAYRFDGFYADASFTQLLGATYEIASLTADLTVYAKFTMLIFSASLDELVPVQLYNYRAGNYTIRLNAADDYAGHAINSGVNSFSENDIWYLVGDATSFKMYSRMAGTDLALKLASIGRDAAATMAPAAEATALMLVEQAGCYAICPVGTPGQSLNMHGGNGHDIKLYNTSDGGSTWLFNLINAEPVSITFDAQLDGGYPLNTRIAEVSINVNGTIGNARWTRHNLASQHYYLPVGATFSMTIGTVYRGWKVHFSGIAEQPLPANGLSATVGITVDEDNQYQYLAYSNDDLYNKPYRIPAIATARNGHLLAVYDYRPCANDVGAGEVDIMLRRSEDNGATWTAEECIANGVGGNQNVFNAGFGDAAIVADRESDHVLVMHVGGKQFFPYATATSHNAVGRIRSADNGLTWAAPEDITAQFMSTDSQVTPILPGTYAMFFASGRIVQSRVYKKDRYYRLYAALLVREVLDGATNPSHNNHVVYSDDFGDTWHTLGGVAVPGGDEAKVEELPDGTIVISSRKSYGRYFNLFTFTDIATAQGKWGSVVASHSQTGGIAFGANSCNGELMRLPVIRTSDGQACDLMLQSVPTGDSRERVTIYYKEMDYSRTYTPTSIAQRWTRGLQVSERGSAYSTYTLQADGRIGFFYEEEPNGYCMVYVPLTIEAITGGAYRLDAAATGIAPLSTLDPQPSTPVYDLMGRPVDKPSRGIYIVGGRKVLFD
ncbi:MAG: exo-alpha-sialidase [Bacteroidaceae bacterium]|nr:exo-alpha-sialidase [Bacteroidaceae bacterium]